MDERPAGHPWSYGGWYGFRRPDTEATVRTDVSASRHSARQRTVDFRAMPPPMSPRDEAQTDAAALRDATGIAARIAADEHAADTAREAYRRDGLPVLQPEERFAALLDPGEDLHAVHSMAILERRDSSTSGGTLLVTSRRLLHAGAEALAWNLPDVEEMSVALERLLLVKLRDGSDLALEVDRPRLLRVQLATAVGARRAATTEKAS
jgi:hypothetical protein